MRQLKVSDLPLVEQPLYRINKLESRSLSDRELVALMIGGEDQLAIASQIVSDCEGNLSKLDGEIDPTSYPGVGEKTAARLKAMLELGRRERNRGPEHRPTVHSPDDAADLLQFEMQNLEQEELRVILLNTRNHVMKSVTVYRGSLNSSHVRITELFKEAVRINAAAIIPVHNHPSGDPTPSPDDIRITKAIREAGDMLDIQVLDHVIIGQGRFVSLKRRGLGFPKEGTR